MQVARQAVHERHLLRQRPNQLGHGVLDSLVNREPRRGLGEVPLHPLKRPLVELFQHLFAALTRLQAQTVAAQVYHLLVAAATTLHGREQEISTRRRQSLVQMGRKGLAAWCNAIQCRRSLQEAGHYSRTRGL